MEIYLERHAKLHAKVQKQIMSPDSNNTARLTTQKGNKRLPLSIDVTERYSWIDKMSEQEESTDNNRRAIQMVENTANSRMVFPTASLSPCLALRLKRYSLALMVMVRRKSFLIFSTIDPESPASVTTAIRGH